MKKLLVLLVLLCSSICLVACRDKINTIKINEESVPNVIDVKNIDSELDKIKLEVINSKGEVSLVKFEKSMMTDADYAKLSNPGTYTIEINYEGFKTRLTLTIEDASAYSVTVLYPNGEPVTSGVKVQWCTGDICLLPVKVNDQGVAYNSIDDDEYYIHIDGIPAGYTYDPNAYTSNKDNKKVTINLLKLNDLSGEGTALSPYVTSEGAFNVTYTGEGAGNMKYYSFTPSVSGTYSIKSLAMDKQAINKIDPYIGFIGTETDMSKVDFSKLDVSGNVDSNLNINFNYRFNAEAGVTYTFVVFVSSATKFPASFDIVICK
ncbi:MAG: hypothetical protein E7183_05460 [Erysipelotrichaceae bacterium]|nr:hypothetical protein [Erysipelotrichaceae bacterium]MBQ4570067.1 hypothetical protein [Bacilli bacterium]